MRDPKPDPHRGGGRQRAENGAPPAIAVAESARDAAGPSPAPPEQPSDARAHEGQRGVPKSTASHPRLREVRARLAKLLGWFAEKAFVILVILVSFKLPGSWTFRLHRLELQQIDSLSQREGEDLVLRIDLRDVRSINEVELRQRQGRLIITAPDLGVPCPTLSVVPKPGNELVISASSSAPGGCELQTRWEDHGPHQADGELRLGLMPGTATVHILGPLKLGGISGELASDPPFFCPGNGDGLALSGWGVELASLSAHWEPQGATLKAEINAWLPWRIEVGHTSCRARAVWK